MSISYSINLLFNFYFFLIILRVFLSWLPNLDWQVQPLKTLNDLVEPFLTLFRKLIPPLGGLDFSPIVALIILQILQNVIVRTLAAYGV